MKTENETRIEAVEKNALVQAHLWLWLVLFGGGLLLGHFLLDPMTEPVAVRWLYPRVAPSAQSHIVRFVDLQPLYERDASEATGGRLPAASFKQFLDTVRKLDKQHRPSAIGFDIPLFQNALPGKGNGVRLTPDREALLQILMKFTQDTEIPVRIGTPQFRLDVQGLQHDFPHLSRFLASTLVYRHGETAPLWFGSGDKDDTLGVLGFAVAVDFLREERFVPGRSALEAQHSIAAPKDLPAELQAAKWVYVDYSLLRQREELTVHVRAEETADKSVGASRLFSAEDLERLEHRDNRGTLWIVGVTEVPEAEDIFVYDEHSQWLGEGEPIRRMYQHGAIANTYLNSPLMHLSLFWTTVIDLAISLSGLMAVLLLEGLLKNNAHDTATKRAIRTQLRTWGWLVLALPYGAVKLTKMILSPVIRKMKGHEGSNPAKTVPEQEKQDGLSRQEEPHHEKGNAGEGAIRIGISMVVFALAFLVSWGLAAGFHWFWFGFVGSAAYALFEPMAAHILHHHS